MIMHNYILLSEPEYPEFIEFTELSIFAFMENISEGE
jgi:hypothetical protein